MLHPGHGDGGAKIARVRALCAGIFLDQHPCTQETHSHSIVPETDGQPTLHVKHDHTIVTCGTEARGHNASGQKKIAKRYQFDTAITSSERKTVTCVIV